MIYSTKRGYTASEIKAISGQHASYLFHVLKDETELPDGQPIAIGQLFNVSKFDADKDGIMTLVDEPTGKLFNWIDAEEKILGPTHQLWCLEFSDIQRIEPFPFTGKQGVGILTEEQKKFIKVIQ